MTRGGGSSRLGDPGTELDVGTAVRGPEPVDLAGCSAPLAALGSGVQTEDLDGVPDLGRRVHVGALAGELSNILGWIEQLNELDTEGVEPMTSVVAMQAPMREDEVNDGGIPDLIEEGRNGWLAEPGSPEDLAHEILAALETERPHAVDAAARETAETLDWSRIADAYLRREDDVRG